MKKNKYLKLGLISMTAVMLIFSTTCKKTDDSADIDVIMNVASQSITDINSFSSLSSISIRTMEHSAVGPCPEDYKHINLSQSCSPWIADSAPGHGWYSGYFDYNLYSNCNIRLTLFSKFDCTLGAVIANTHDKLGGSLSITGSFDINVSGVVIMSINEAGIFEVNGRSHNVFLTLRVNGDSTGHGTITISGSIDGGAVFDSISY